MGLKDLFVSLHFHPSCGLTSSQISRALGFSKGCHLFRFFHKEKEKTLLEIMLVLSFFCDYNP
jgi:hypothetical protein